MAMSLTDEQKKSVAHWVAEGASLAEVQKRLNSEFSISLTYMDTRFLLDDLNLALKEKPKTVAATDDLTKAAPAPGPAVPVDEPESSPVGGKVRVSVDKIVRPGAVVSGNVVFSDGQNCAWQLDQSGRLGLVPQTKGYKPSQTDVQEFQYALQDELARLGY